MTTPLDIPAQGPIIHDFETGVVNEAEYQRHHWGLKHDSEKEPQDWFWLIGYLAGKALRAEIDEDYDKALHHAISTAAACSNWHRTMLDRIADRS